jgi:V-type H+-transporting ATPase subunit d
MDSDYADYIKEYNEQDTTSLKLMLKRKLSDEVDYLQMVAGPELQKFLQMIRHKYMIDNVINIIEGTKNKTSKEIIQGRSEPLGYLPEISGLINLNVIDELYEDVLIDTEVGYYFSALLEETLQNSEDKKFNAIQYYLQELKPENLKNYLKKIWLEHFYLYSQTLSGSTRDIMEEILKFEADCQTLQIIYNSISFQGFSQEEERRKIIPNFGKIIFYIF